jgi:lysophospholipase L1-like esterase
MGTLKSERLRNLALLAASILVTLMLTESALRILDFPRQPMKPERVKDPILVYKMPADWPGIDKDGFLNRSIPGQSDIVTLGDSHTYGFNADVDSNWPGRLQKLTGLSVYNLGIGGYGPLQYYYLFDRALQLKPKYIVVGLYLPNDIKGVCHPYQRTQYWKTRAPQEGLDLGYCEQMKIVDEDGQGRNARRADPFLKVERFVAESKIGTLIGIAASPLLAYLPNGDDGNVVISHNNNDTVISKMRLRDLHDNMDLNQPKIARSLEMTKTLISRMAARSRQNGIELIVMVIPSREYIFHELLSGSRQDLPEIYQQMASSEAILRADIASWLTAQGLPYVDIAPKLLEAVKSQGDIYPRINDGHPLPAGYAAYANALYEAYFAKQNAQ